MARLPGICGIEFGRDAICIVHYLPDENTVTTFGIEPLDDSPSPWWQSVESVLRPLVRTMRANGRSLSGGQVACSLPAEHAVVTRLLVDSADLKPEENLRWQLGQHLVGGLDEFVCDFQQLRPPKPGQMVGYLAAACRASWADRARVLLRKREFVPRVLDLDIFALINAFEANYRESVTAPAFLVLGGQQCTKVILTWNGGLVDYEHFAFNIDLEQPADYGAKVRSTVERLRTTYAGLVGKASIPVFVSGSMFTWDKYASECFHVVANMRMLNPFRNVGCDSVPESSLRVNGPRLAVAVGLAIREAAVVRK